MFTGCTIGTETGEGRKEPHPDELRATESDRQRLKTVAYWLNRYVGAHLKNGS